MNKMRVLSFILAILMVFSIMPIPVFAEASSEQQQKEQLLKEELRKAADETQYPNGLFDLQTARMNTSENLPMVEFAIIRKGGTAGKASVTLKAIDVTAKYGEDYTISVQKGLISQTLAESPDSKSLIESFEGIDHVQSDAENISGTTAASLEYTATSSTTADGLEYEELPASQQKESSGLRAARDAFTGKTSERPNWRQMDQETKDSTLKSYNETYEAMPGVTHTFDFEDGEYIKKIRFNTLDDSISEDEEQVVFALLSPVGGTLGDAYNGFMNIEDNEEKENVQFEMAEEEITADRIAGCAEVTVRRTAGLQRYGIIQVGTAALTAQPDIDYKPVTTELQFVPGQETQKVKIPLIEGGNGEELQFLVKLDPESPNLSTGGKDQTMVTIEASPRYLMTPMDGSAQMLSMAEPLLNSAGMTTEEYNGKTYHVKTLTADDIAGGDYKVENGKAHMRLSSGLKTLNFNQELSLAEFIQFQWSSVIDSTISSFTSFMSIGPAGSSYLLKKSGKFGATNTTYTLSDKDRNKSNIYFGVQGVSLSGKGADLSLGDVKLYYSTYNIMLKDLSDGGNPDADIMPQIWTTPTTSEPAVKTALHIGALAFVNDSGTSTKTYAVNEIVSLVPKFTNSKLDSSKVYLWGYKIERLGGHPEKPYYYVTGDQLDISKLRAGTLKDKDGAVIPLSQVLMKNDTIVLLPVFKARNAYVQINFNTQKGGMAKNSFSNGQTIKIGMLDTVKFNAFAYANYAVSGYASGHTNNVYYHILKATANKKSVMYVYTYDSAAIPTNDRERELNEKDVAYGNEIINDSKNSSQFTPIDSININSGIPNELELTPQKTYSRLTVQYGIPVLTVKADPAKSGEGSDNERGSVAYFPKEGTAQTGNSSSPMAVSPIERNSTYTISGIPEKGYRVLWKDWSGDTNGDGQIDDKEYSSISEYDSLFDRNVVYGDFYTYAANYDNPLIYYTFEPQTTGSSIGSVWGEVYLKGRSILGDMDEQDTSDSGKALSDIDVFVNGHSVWTDKDGKFKIESSDFASNEYHSLIINYKGINYTGHVQTNCFHHITIEEYDTFVPYNFTAHDSDGTAVNFGCFENRDKNYTFRFEVNSTKPGVYAQKAIVRIYSKEGVQRGSNLEVIPQNGVYSFDFNPATQGVIAGDSMTVQLVDQYGISYLEHDAGFTFLKYLDTFSLLSSFKSPLKPAVDMLGKIDTAFDLGLAGKADKYMDKSSADDWYIRFGFSKEWEKSLSDGSKVEDDSGDKAEDKLKDTASEDADNEDKVEETADEAIDGSNGEKKSASMTTDMKLGISTALYLHMTINRDHQSDQYGQAYFKEMIMSVTLTGGYHKKIERMTPIGVTVFVDFGLDLDSSITGIMVIEQYDNKKFYFDDKGQIDFSSADSDDPNRDFTIYGKLIVKPNFSITAGGEIGGATLSVTGSAKFDLNFTTSGSGNGKVTFDATTTLDIPILFHYEWEIAQKSWNLFNYGLTSDSLLGDTSYLYEGAEDYQIMSRDYLNNRRGWQEGKTGLLSGAKTTGAGILNEQVLQTGVYPYPYTLLATIGENQQLLVFLDDDVNQDERNRTQLFYSIYNGTSWSTPQKVDGDDTPDGLPCLYDMGDKVLVAWSSSVSPVHSEDTVMEAMNNRDIKARFFDKTGKTFGEVQEVTHETKEDTYSDSEPYIAYNKDDAGKENLMIVYKKNEYGATGSSEDKDAVVGDIINPSYSTLAYRFYDFDSNTWDVGGDKLDGYYGQGFIDVTDYVGVDESNILITGDDLWDGYWSGVPSTSEVALKYLPGNDPLIVDSNAVGYKDYAILAYVLDMDGNIGTTDDREMFIQLYSFKDKVFYTPIRCTDDITGQYDLEFSQANDTLYLYYISDGDIMAMDIGHLLKNGLLEYDIDGKPEFVLNKSKDAYSKPQTVVRHRYDTSTDALGNETRENEMPVDEFMVKADEANTYIMWGENDITCKDGVEPDSDAAALPENQYREHHIYAARQTIGNVTSTQLYEQDGVTPLTYPAVDDDGDAIDYAHFRDINNEVGKANAGDPVVLIGRPTEWSDPVKLTEGEGANYNDLDFEILPDGNLRAVFVKGFSEVTDVAGTLMSVENVNHRSLMTADFDVSVKKAEVELEQVSMPKPKETVPVEFNIHNLSLSALDDVTAEVYQISGGVSVKVAEEALRLRGGETIDMPLLWQAPENLENTKLQVVVRSGGETLCSTEQSMIAGSIVDVRDAWTEYKGRNRVKISGTAVNNGNVGTTAAEILAEVSGKTIGSINVGSLDVDETRRFEFYADIQPGMFENTIQEDGSVNAVMEVAVHSPDGTGMALTCDRYASAQDINTINNIKSFGLKNGSTAIQGSVTLKKGGTMNIKPYLTYTDDTLPKPRLVYASSNVEVADFSGGSLIGKKDGTATITAYVVPQKSELILSQSTFEKVDNLETLPEAAVKMKSFVVNVGKKSGGETNSSIGLNPTVPNTEATAAGNTITNNNTITITTMVKTTADTSGKATAAVTAAQINEAAGRAAEESAKQGQTAAINIKVEAPANAKTVETNIPTAAVNKIVNSGIEALSISSPIANITFSNTALTSILTQAGDNMRFTASVVDTSALPAEVQRTVGERPVFDFSVTSGDKTISRFGRQVTVSVPYTPKAGEDRNAIVIYYINDEGKLEIVSNCAYDAETGMVTFKTDHFSKYAIGYNKVSFKDVAVKSWYSNAVGFIAARGITTGTGDGRYSPEEGLTRGQFLVMAMKAYGMAPDGNPADNFTDAGSTYYTGYLAAAKRLGISAGAGDNRYAPDKEITRQEMFTLLYNVLKLRGELPRGASGKSLTTFHDSDQIASWAKEAIKLLTITGTVSGSNGRLSPKDTTTRAQMAQVLYNLLRKLGADAQYAPPAE